MRMDWDYLIVTASNDRQARAYERQLAQRKELGLLQGCREVLVVPDTGGRRIGSGGSTLLCLMQILARGLGDRNTYVGHPQLWRETLGELRILIVHAGGDSRRLPAYSPCGKIFVPVPGVADSGLPTTLLDRQLPTYLKLPAADRGIGQTVITSGDVLLRFDPERVRFGAEGITGLACYAWAQEASHHGVFCGGENGPVQRFLQKPSEAEQQRTDAADAHGRLALDIGVMNLTAGAAVGLLELFGMQLCTDGRFGLFGPLGEAVEAYGLDFYREICCAMGRETTQAEYTAAVGRAGSCWTPDRLGRLFDGLRKTPLRVHILPSCEFLHFGTSSQLISSGNYLLQQDHRCPSANTVVCLNTSVGPAGRLAGTEAWVEGCRIEADVKLEGQNLLVGVDVDESLALPAGACVDVIPGRSSDGGQVWFVRIYGIHDTFQGADHREAVFCGMPLDRWLEAVGAEPGEVWPDSGGPEEQTLWHARLFPAVGEQNGYRQWLWMYEPQQARDEQRAAWRRADRSSLAEMAQSAAIEAFHARRDEIHRLAVLHSLGGRFAAEGGFSAADLAHLLSGAQDAREVTSVLLAEARRCHENGHSGGTDLLVFPRVIHTIGSTLQKLGSGSADHDGRWIEAAGVLPDDQRNWLKSMGLEVPTEDGLETFTGQLQAVAFEYLGRAILSSGGMDGSCPRAKLRSDEIVWGRAPARLDTGGGWTDTPPYSLEHGGAVVNTAVNLNGQPPIQAYLRIIPEPVIRIGSIDLGTKVEIHSLEALLDYRRPDSEYGLAKAALALSGFAPGMAPWAEGISLERMLKLFGGGIELTTLAAVPKGSGLGTSSIMGAVLLAVIGRAMGRQFTQRELFNAVLKLEQLLTTGGGWQDQIGGAVGGAKVISTEPGLVPDARIEYLVPDVLDPQANGGCTLLYYTGITRLAKGILGQVVGHYLDRDRATVATLQQIHELAPRVAEAMSRKDGRTFGELVGRAWELNKQLDPGSTNDQVESLLSRVGRHVHGAKLLGAGGGGFLLMVCKSPDDAGRVRRMLEVEPANSRARFFDYQINRHGLVVTAC